MLNFMFTSCPSVCPRQTRLLAEARAQLPEHVLQRVHFLSVSVDPENDDPRALEAFAKKMGADVPGWRFARVDETALRELSKRLVVFEPSAAAQPGVAPAPSAHTSSAYLFDREGRPVQRYGSTTIDPARLAREIIALDALGRPKTRHDGPVADASPSRLVRSDGGLR